MKHPARWIAGAVAAVVVVFGVVLALNVGNDPQQVTSRLLDKPAPAFELKTLDGSPVSSASLAGKTVIVNFWNEWCGPCIAELPALKKFWAAHAADGDVEMVGILRDSQLSTKKLRRYLNDEGIDWTIARDPGSQAALAFATRGQPETFAISPSGRIVGYQLSEMNVAGLEAMVQTARNVG